MSKYQINIITYRKATFKVDGELKIFQDKQKIKLLKAIKPAQHRILKQYLTHNKRHTVCLFNYEVSGESDFHERTDEQKS